MSRYRTKGTDLFDEGDRKVASVQGAEIYDSDNNKVASLTHVEVYDSQNKLMATLRESGVYDSRGRKIARLSDIYDEIDSALGGPALIGLWMLFVRKQSPTIQSGPTAQDSPTRMSRLLHRIFRFGG